MMGLMVNFKRTYANMPLPGQLLPVPLFLRQAPKSLGTVTAAMKLKDACFLKEKL